MSRYLLDTNVISEVVRPAPHEAVLQWLSPLPESSLYLSAITIGELVKGIVALEEGQKKTRLERWMNTDIPALFAGRILSYDEQAARLWGYGQVKESAPADRCQCWMHRLPRQPPVMIAYW